MSKKVGRENIVRVSFHFDEETPHAHIDFVPVVTRERVTKHKRDMVTTLDAQRLLGGPVELEQWWTDYAEMLKSKGYDVERATTAAERMERGIKRPVKRNANDNANISHLQNRNNSLTNPATTTRGCCCGLLTTPTSRTGWQLSQ